MVIHDLRSKATYKYKVKSSFEFSVLCAKINVPCEYGDSLEFRFDGVPNTTFCTDRWGSREFRKT